jgi:O-antigen ligase
VHPTYWSYLLILINTILLGYKQLSLELKRTTVLILLVIFNFNLLFLSARTPLVINGIIHIVAIIINLKKIKFSVVKIIGGSLFIIIFGLLAFNLPLLKAKVLMSNIDERFYLWPKALEQIKVNYYFLGEGLGQGVYVLKDFIIEKGDPRVHYRGFDLHNQYLTHYLDMGLLGLLSLIYLIIFPITLITRKKLSNQLPIVGFCLLFLLGILTETSLYFIKGIIIFAVFSSVLMKKCQHSIQ